MSYGETIMEVIGDATLLLGDSREILPRLSRNFAVVTDPPYGIGFKYNSHEDTEEFLSRFMDLLVGRPTALLQYPEEMMRIVCPKLGAPSEVMAWVYPSNLPRQLRLWGFWNIDCNPAKSKQAAKNLDCSKVKSSVVAGYDWREIDLVKGNSAEKSDHPCQLPLRCAEWVLECIGSHYVVVDPFMGSGTVGVACAKMGKQFFGIEKDPKYFDIACERIYEAYRQPRLFPEAADPAPKQEELL